MPAGYSGTPLPKKLGIREADRVGLIGAPRGIAETIGALPEGARLVPLASGGRYGVVMLFARTTVELDRSLPRAWKTMAATTSLWICWPKKTSPLHADVTGDVVRAAGLAAGLVDVKVCAVDEDWSGLKFVVRLKDRPAMMARKK